MKILHVIDSMCTGGAEILLLDVINEFESRKIFEEQHLICIYNRKDDWLLNQLPKSLKIKFLNAKKSNILSRLFYLRSYFNKNNFSIIHTHLCDATLFTRLALPSRTYIISTYHGQYYNKNSDNYSNWRKWLDKFTYNNNQYLIFVSETVKEVITKAIGISKNYDIINNFANKQYVPKYVYNNNNVLKLVAVGSLRKPKNYLLAIDGLTIKDITLDIYGDGEMKNELERHIKENNSNVILKGNQQITSDLLAQYDAFLMTSSHEGMPVALIEAMKTGLPAIVSDIPAIKNVCGNAAIYFKSNDVDSLRQILLDILYNKSILASISKKAIENSKEYDIDTYINKLISIYNKVIN